MKGLPSWKELLTEASERVMRITMEIEGGKSRSRVVGRGAAGDDTLLADKKAEAVWIEALSAVPGLGILSEEAGPTGDPKASSLAVLDPLDGSSNFERRIPFYCTSVAIVEGTRFEAVSHALVRNLMTGDIYYAEKGKGSTKNGKRIRTTLGTDLGSAVAGIDLSRSKEATTVRVARLLPSIRRQVHFGANALELCLVAEGKIDAFIDIRGRLRVVDFAAARLIAEEAGAVTTLVGGGHAASPITLEGRFSLIASANQGLHREILSALGKLR